MRRVWLIMIVICLALGMTACGQPKASGQKPQTSSKSTKKTDSSSKKSDKSSKKMSTSSKKAGKSSKKMGASSKKTDKTNNQKGDPKLRIQSLEGGSEKENRVIKALDNYMLQRKHPNTFMLHASPERNQVALTFDDGPDSRFTPQVLDILKKHGVKATFFVMGSRVDGLPKITKRIADEGHAFGNHTYWHPKLWKENMDRVHWEIEKTEQALLSTVGYRTKLFRAPYGSYTEELMNELERLNYSVIGWNVDSLDWKQLNEDQCSSNVLSNVRPGSIILMHSGGDWTQDLSGMVKALDRIIPELKNQGLNFVTIPQLITQPK